jgi:hypothetical protein
MRCKFKLWSIGEPDPDGLYNLHFQAVSTGSEENALYWKWTPNGELKIFTVNAKAVEGLTLGAEYYIDVTPCAPTEAKKDELATGDD